MDCCFVAVRGQHWQLLLSSGSQVQRWDMHGAGASTLWLQQAESGGGCRFHAQWWDRAVSNLLPFSSPDAASVQGRQLLAGLEKVHSDLDKLEKAITANLRPPLEQSRAVQDSTERSKDLKVQGHRSRHIVPCRDPAPKAGVLPRGLQGGSWCAACCWCSQNSMKAWSSATTG